MTPATVASVPVREDLLHADALLDALVELCRAQGLAATRASLSAGLPLAQGLLTVPLLERAAERAGLATRLLRQPLARMDNATLPALLLLQDQRACVLLKVDAISGQAYTLWPETGQGQVTLPVADLQARYSGIALFGRPKYRPAAAEATPGASTSASAANAKGARPSQWFWQALATQRGVYQDVLLAALLVNLFALALPLFTMNVYDRVVPNHAVETLWALAVGVVFVLGADLLLRLMRSRFVDEASARVDVQLSATLMERVLGMRLEGRPDSVGAFAANLRGFEQVRDFVASGTVTTLIDLPFALLFLAVVAWISPLLALPVLVAGVLILASGWLLQSRLHALSLQTHQASAQRNATLVESLTGLETLKALGAEGQMQARWERTNAHLATTQVQMRALSARASQGTQFLAQLANVAVVVLGVFLIQERELTVGALVACTMLGSRALAPAGLVVGLLLQYQGARTALESLNAVMARPQERAADQVPLQRPQVRGAIEFRHVSFSYPGQQEKVLDDVSFSVKPGEHVAFIGRVGSGKSSLLRLAQGLYQPTGGAVLVDGIDIRQLDCADLRRAIGVVSQEVQLFHGSLRENITLGLPHADDDAVLRAAEVAGLNDFVQRHPSGFGLAVGERGERLSGGQRQAVGLARAALHQAPLLLLDEPTSAMDYSTEAQTTARMNEFAGGKTMLLVTHRSSMLALAERVIVLDAGRIVADGPRDSVMQALNSGRIGKAV